MIDNRSLHTDLRIFLGIITTLILIGFIFIYSASSVYALEKFNSAHYFVKKQFFGLCIGLIGLFICRITPLKLIKHIALLIFLCALALTTLTLIPSFSHTIHGSSRWILLGLLSFQPSEFLKHATLINVASFLAHYERLLPKIAWHTYLLLLLYILLPAIVLLQQPDFGMAFTIILTCLIMFFIIRFSFKQFIIILTTLLSTSLLLIIYHPYRLKRILIFLNPWSDPQGAGFQIIQSLIAIGSGGLWGVGISYSKQKFFYLPMQHTDFIFSIIAEETGLIGSCLLIFLYALLLYFGMRIAWQLQRLFYTLFTLGFVLIINIQAVINFGVTLGIIPTKGMGLPFISAGNSSLISSLCMVGLIINAVHSTIKNSSY